jgi:4-hydroxybenzoate polyprenyltransferase
MEPANSSVATKVADLRVYSAYLGISIFVALVILGYFAAGASWYLILGFFSIVYLLMNIYLLVISYKLSGKPRRFWQIWTNVFTGVCYIFLCLYSAGGLF